MGEPATSLIIAATGVTGLGMASAAALKGWRGWLDLKRLELAAGRSASAPSSAATRIEMADLKERVKKLEAIASGIDI